MARWVQSCEERRGMIGKGIFLPRVEQFVRGLEQMPIPIDDEALVVSDNADIYGTVTDIWQRR
jgi:hypothetical protein